jgi:hypothetical protein
MIILAGSGSWKHREPANIAALATLWHEGVKKGCNFSDEAGFPVACGVKAIRHYHFDILCF